MVAGKRGPAPKREAERNRVNKPEDGITPVEMTDKELAALPFEVELLVEPPPAPEGKEAWHKIAEQIYSALLRDPARIWMGPAGWAVAYLMCENISRHLKPVVVGVVDGGIDPETGDRLAGHVARDVVPMKGTDIAAVLKWASAVGVNEGDRLGMRKEITFNEAQTRAPGASDDEAAATREGFFSVEGGRG